MAHPLAPTPHRGGTPDQIGRRSFLVIRNPHAGRTGARLTNAVLGELTAAGATVRVEETASPDACRALLAEVELPDAFIAAGGDGTIRALAFNLRDLGIDRPVGIIPAGTGNVLAREIGIGFKPREIARALMTAPARDAQVASANGTPFLLMCGVGFDAEILLRLSVSLKQRVGRSAYTTPTLAAFTRSPLRPFAVDLDGMPATCTWAIIANARKYGGSFTIAPEASIFEANLHAVLFKATTRAGRLREMLALGSGRIASVGSVEIRQCRQAVIRAPARMPSQVDGDALGFGPVEVRQTGETIPLIAP